MTTRMLEEIGVYLPYYELVHSKDRDGQINWTLRNRTDEFAGTALQFRDRDLDSLIIRAHSYLIQRKPDSTTYEVARELCEENEVPIQIRGDTIRFLIYQTSEQHLYENLAKGYVEKYGYFYRTRGREFELEYTYPATDHENFSSEVIEPSC